MYVSKAVKYPTRPRSPCEVVQVAIDGVYVEEMFFLDDHGVEGKEVLPNASRELGRRLLPSFLPRVSAGGAINPSLG